MIWKKEKKNKLLFSDVSVIGGIKSEEVLSPSMEKLPSYWSKLNKGIAIDEKMLFFKFMRKFNAAQNPQVKQQINNYINDNKIDVTKDGRSKINAAVCPSFVDIFRNSYIFKTPCEIYVEITDKGYDVHSANSEVMQVNRHDLKSQLWGNHNPNLFNIKFGGNWLVKTTQKTTKIVFFDNILYNDLPFRVMPGVLKVTNKFSSFLNLNTYIDRRNIPSKGYTKILKTGTPLGLLYMPDGLLEIEDKRFEESGKRYFMGDYLKKTLKL